MFGHCSLLFLLVCASIDRFHRISGLLLVSGRHGQSTLGFCIHTPSIACSTLLLRLPNEMQLRYQAALHKNKSGCGIRLHRTPEKTVDDRSALPIATKDINIKNEEFFSNAVPRKCSSCFIIFVYKKIPQRPQRALLEDTFGRRSVTFKKHVSKGTYAVADYSEIIYAW